MNTPRNPRPDLVDLRGLTTHWRIRLDTERLPVIPGRHGHVSAHDLTTLCVCLRGARLVRKTLRALPPGWRRHQTGDEEANILAPVADLDRAAKMVQAYRRRHLSPEHRAKITSAHRVAGRFMTENPAIGPEVVGRAPFPGEDRETPPDGPAGVV